ncbi:MAG: hypothetical protein J5597_04740 [Spirochaetaceae bacterium]|nr:hypothetical protein [Spirochaetaceae bacterium]
METKVTYYPISESAARRAKNANSFSDYIEGSATADYRRMVDEAAEIAERQKKRVDPEYHARIDSLLDAYARKLADNINQANNIDASVPSVMIAGPANFPIHKKEKQNARRDANMREYESIKGILDTIRSVGTGGITSDDPRALEKLRKKLAELEALQEKMKAVNAYYRKNKTLEGCPQLETVSIERLTASMETFDRQPYPAWALSNNNANIHRVRERIAVLEKEAERAAEEPAEISGEGYTVRENSSIGRIQIVFDGKPSAEVRELLKANGFRWAPSEGAWQRLLNDHARSAAEYVTNKIKDMEVF